MEIEIRRVWCGDLAEYKNVLDKHEAVYIERDTRAIIKINDVADLLDLSEELGKEIIIETDGKVAIYDERIE